MIYKVRLRKTVTSEVSLLVDAASTEEAVVKAELEADATRTWRETELNWFDSNVEEAP